MKNTMMSDLEKYKTELCAHYEEKGSCPLGSICKFAHGELELRSRLNNKIHLYLETSKFQKINENTSSYMPKMKTIECKFYKKYGNCKYERSCHFAHGENDLKNTKTKDNLVFSEKFCDNNNTNDTNIRKNLLDIKKLVENGGINEASNKLYDLYNKINFYDEDKILRINNNNKLSGFEIIAKQNKDIDEVSLLSDSISVDQIFNKKEKFKILETEIKICNYSKYRNNEFTKVSI